MTEPLDDQARATLAAMPAEQLTALLADLRADEPATPTARAAAALRSSRRLDRSQPVTKARAAEAVRKYRSTH